MNGKNLKESLRIPHHSSPKNFIPTPIFPTKTFFLLKKKQQLNFHFISKVRGFQDTKLKTKISPVPLFGNCFSSECVAVIRTISRPRRNDTNIIHFSFFSFFLKKLPRVISRPSRPEYYIRHCDYDSLVKSRDHQTRSSIV